MLLGEAMLKAGIVSEKQFQEAKKEKTREELDKICENIDKRFPNAPDFLKLNIFIAENKIF